MTKLEEIERKIGSLIDGAYDVQETDHVPTIEEVPFDNKGIQLDACVFFVDLRQSSLITNAFRRQTVAKIYKAFLWAAVRLVRDCQGEIRSFSGDSILSIFTGESKESRAVQSALRLKFVLQSILQPKLAKFFETSGSTGDRFDLDLGIGIATGDILAVKAGSRGTTNQDLVWIGNPTNLASKLADEAAVPYNIWISKGVFDVFPVELRVTSNRPMWEALNVRFAGEELTVYRTRCGESF